MDKKFTATVKDQDDHFQNASRLVNAHHEPPPGVILIIEWARVQGMLIGIQDGLICEPVAPKMLACTGVHWRAV